MTWGYIEARRAIERHVADGAGHLARTLVGRIEVELRSVERIAEMVALSVATGPPTEAQLKRLLAVAVRDNPEVYGIIVAFEPFAFRGRRVPAFAPYYFRPDRSEVRGISAGGDYRGSDWYRTAAAEGKPGWTDAHVWGGAVSAYVATYVVPVFRERNGTRELIGVVGADVSLQHIKKVLLPQKILARGYPLIVSRKGLFIVHPLEEFEMQRTIEQATREGQAPEVAQVADRITRGESGFATVRSVLINEPCWLYYTPIPSTGWSLNVIFPQGDLMEDVVRLTRRLSALVVVALLFVAGSMTVIARSITRPLRQMAAATSRVALGDLDSPLPDVTSRDEVGDLAQSFRRMQGSLKEYIGRLTEETRLMERVESELKIARSIQLGLLPGALPPDHRFGLSVFLEPAREVGGDYYDFFLLEDGRLFICIADVSGQGMPAALFMAETRGLIRSHARMAGTPAAVAARLNGELCQGNDSMMFVTLFCGMLDLANGEFMFSNAGHNPPVRLSVNGEASFLSLPRGLVLGARREAVYADERIFFAAGDALLLYTDGVTEARDRERSLFGNDRLIAACRDWMVDRPGGIVSHVLAALRHFTGEERQSDDVALLSLTYCGPPERRQ